MVIYPEAFDGIEHVLVIHPLAAQVEHLVMAPMLEIHEPRHLLINVKVFIVSRVHKALRA
jgi:hypothetical protein